MLVNNSCSVMLINEKKNNVSDRKALYGRIILRVFIERGSPWQKQKAIMTSVKCTKCHHAVGSTRALLQTSRHSSRLAD